MKILIIGIICLILGAVLANCGKASAGNVTVQMVAGPDGSSCYVFMQGAQAIGGNCK